MDRIRDTVELVSSDATTSFHVAWDVAIRSELIRLFLSSASNFNEGSTGRIVLGNISASVLQLIVKYLQSEVMKDGKVVPVKKFTIPPSLSLEVLMAADYLQLPDLISEACNTIANNFHQLETFGSGIPEEHMLSVAKRVNIEGLFRLESMLPATKEARSTLGQAWKKACIDCQLIADGSARPPDLIEACRLLALRHHVEECVRASSLGTMKAALMTADGDAMSLIQTLQRLGPLLTSFKLRNSVVEPKLLDAIIQNLPNIAVLDLSSNNLDRVSGLEIARSLRSQRLQEDSAGLTSRVVANITALDLSSTGIGGDTVRALAGALLGSDVGKLGTRSGRRSRSETDLDSSTRLPTSTNPTHRPRDMKRHFTKGFVKLPQLSGALSGSALTEGFDKGLKLLPLGAARDASAVAVAHHLPIAGGRPGAIVHIKPPGNSYIRKSFPSRKFHVAPRSGLDETISVYGSPSKPLSREVPNSVASRSTLSSSPIAAHNTTKATSKLKNQSIMNSQQLSLILRKNPLGDVAVVAISDTLASSPGSRLLRHLDLSENHVGEAGGMCLAEIVRHHSALESLKIANCGVGSPGVKAICLAVLDCSHGKPAKQLSALDIAGNTFDRGVVTCAGGAIAAMLESHAGIEYLNIGGNFFRNEGYEAIANVLAKNSSLRRLEMNAMVEPPSTGMSRVMAASGSSHLESLNLSSNKLPASSLLESLNTMLAGNVWLKILNLSGNCIDAEVARILGIALTVNHCLRDLNLATVAAGTSKMRSEGASELFECLTRNRSLESISIAGHGIRNTGALAIARLLHALPLKYLNLKKNHIDNRGATAFAEAAEHWPGGISVYPVIELQQNNIDPSTWMHKSNINLRFDAS